MSSDERQVRQSLVNGRGERRPGPSKLATHARVQRGSAAPLCGKPPAFRPAPDPSSSSAQAERLSLPACAEEVLRTRALRKGEEAVKILNLAFFALVFQLLTGGKS